MTKDEAFQIDAERGIPVCLLGIGHEDLVSLVQVMRENVARTDELILILAGQDHSSSEFIEADLELDQIATDMDFALSNQSIPMNDFEMEALGLLTQKPDWPGNPVTEQEVATSHMVDTLLNLQGI
ncbi:hypothetical protein hairong_136 [Pseudomonas phage hairong]|nr:hypothetical protein hairong_136 [Pseudomonas phage hairong]